MKKEKAKYSNQEKAPDLDCCVCIYRKACERQAEGSFCSRFRSVAFDPGRRDPLKIWEEERKKKWEARKENMKDN